MKSNYQDIFEKALDFVANKGWSEQSDKFLDALAKFLGELLNVDYVLIDRYSLNKPGVAETVAIYNRGNFMPNMEYELQYTPCENVINCKLCSYETNIQTTFPNDDLLKQMNVDSYCGIPLWSSSGEPIGLIALMDKNPLANVKQMELILQVVAIKAAHELEKMIFDDELKIKNEKIALVNKELEEKYNQLLLVEGELIASNKKLLIAKEKSEEKEARYRGLFDKVADAIFVYNPDNFEILEANKATEIIYGYSHEELIGMSCLKFSAEVDKSKKTAEEVKHKGEQIVHVRHHKKKDNSDLFVKISVYNLKINEQEISFAVSQDITEKLVAEQSLQRSKTLLSEAEVLAKIGSWEWDIKNDVAHWSDGLFNIFKLDPKEGAPNWEQHPNLYVKEDFDKYTKVVEECMVNGTPYEFGLRAVCSDGEIKKCIARGAAERDKDQVIVRMYGTLQDITEQKEVEKELTKAKENAEKNELRLMDAQSVAKVGSWETDLKTMEVNWSDETYKIFELNRSDFENSHPSFLNYVHKDDIERIEEVFAKSFSSTEYNSVQHRIITPSGTLKHVEERWRVEHDANMQPLVAFGTCQDITIQKDFEKELIKAKDKAEESELQLKLIANNFVNGMLYQVALLSDTERKFKYVSEAVNELYGCTPQEAMENPDLIYGKLHPDDIGSLIEKEKEALKNMSVFKAEARVINPDGSIRWAYYISKPRIIDGIACWDGIELDITERKQMEFELQTAKEKAEESNRLKTEFLNNMSHEIRTPMNGIVGFADFLDKPDLPQDKQRYFTRIIKNSSFQLLRIIDDILEISTLGTKQVKVRSEVLSVNDLLMELFSVFDIKAKEKQVPLYLKKGLKNDHCFINSDKSKILKVLNNLLENALKYTNSGFVELGYAIVENNVQFFVKDTGIGIDSKNYTKIFERFSQEEKAISTKYGGLGLGLSIAKENAELLKGTLSLESVKGKGSVFYFSIPYDNIQKNKKPDGISDTIQNSSMQKQYTIVVAEDEEVNYLYIEAVLEEVIGFSVNIIHAKDGQEAVDFCKTNNTIDLILMDIKMPNLNGFEAANIIKSMNPDLPIIAQTAYSTELDRQKAINSGCDDFISKPLNSVKLISKIKKHLLVE